MALKEVEPLTGYIRGGVTALACKKNYPVYLDETAQLFDVISISAGVRGLQVLLAPDDVLPCDGRQTRSDRQGQDVSGDPASQTSMDSPIVTGAEQGIRKQAVEFLRFTLRDSWVLESRTTSSLEGGISPS